MPETFTWGHVLMLAGLLAGLYALVNVLRWFRQREHGRGTPRYAEGRLARRSAVYGVAIALVLFAIGCLTPLGEAPIA